MARTLDEIYAEIIAEKNEQTVLSTLQPNIDSSQTLLSQLTTTSKVAIWRLLFHVVAIAIWAHEQLFDSHKEEVESIVVNQRVGSIPWYIAQAKLFQEGDDLSYNEKNYRYEYATFDETKQVVVQAAAVEVEEGQIMLKVAKQGSSALEALSTAQKALFEEYINEVKFAGTRIEVISAAADDLRINLNIIYDPLVLRSTGESIASTGTYPVTTAINAYLEALPFNGLFRVTEFVEALKAVSGVEDVIAKNVEARHGAIAFENVLATDTESYQSYSGYMSVDTATLVFIEK